MNHKRKRPKSSRAGCLLCKPHKLQRGKNGAKRQRVAVQREMQESVGPWFTRHHAAVEHQRHAKAEIAALYAEIEYGPRRIDS